MTATIDIATALHARLAALNMDDVPVLSVPRSVPRKELAAEARKLFKMLAIKGISVTAPNYSMAQAVDVTIPRREDHDPPHWRVHECEKCQSCSANGAATAKVRAILDKAFPKHDDRSDSMSDHFDYKWSIH